MRPMLPYNVQLHVCDFACYFCPLSVLGSHDMGVVLCEGEGENGLLERSAYVSLEVLSFHV